MKSNELLEKVTKAAEKVEKCKKTIERHQKQADKKLAIIKKNGWNPEDPWCRKGTEEHNEACWSILEYGNKLDDIKNAEEKLADAERILQNWKDKYEEQVKNETTIAWELPDFLIELKEQLTDEWTQFDIESRNRMSEMKRELNHTEFRQFFSYTQEVELSKTEEEFRKENERSAEGWVLNLYNRVKAVTGEVTSWKGITFAGKALNGTVVGKNGTAVVETILAGGYNIQKLHMRVLVHRYEK